MKNLGFVDNLKLRASWGQTGNERIDAFCICLSITPRMWS